MAAAGKGRNRYHSCRKNNNLIIRKPLPPTNQPSLLPVLSLLLAATLWGVIWYPLRLLEDHGLSGLWSTLVSYASALLVASPLLVMRRGELGRQPLPLALLLLAAGWTNVAFVLAVIEGPVVRVLLLFYLSPVWTVLLGWIVLHERLTLTSLGVLMLALTGAVIMLWDPSLGAPWPAGRADWLAVSAGAAFAVNNVCIRQLQQVSLAVKSVVSWVGVVLVAALGLWFTGTASPPVVTAGVWWSAAALGVFGFLVMTLAVQHGVTHMPVQRSAVILLFELVAGAVSAWWLAGEALVLKEWIGGGLIVGGAWLAARQQVRSE